MVTLDTIIDEFEKDPIMKAELDKARQWYADNREEIIAGLEVCDLEVVDGRLVFVPANSLKSR